MKFLHLGDLHLGKYLADFDLLDDQRYILDQILELIEKESVDAVLIAGDVYDRANPNENAISLLDWFLNELSSMDVQVFLISGNHDSDDRLNYGSWVFEKQKIYISSVFNGSLVHRGIKIGDVAAEVYMLPFVKASQVRHFYDEDENIKTYEDAVRTVIDHADIDESKVNILIAHQFVSGRGEDPSLGGSESVATQNVGTIEKISADVFDKFDYVALGHIHSPQQVGRQEVRYAGSPLKYSKSEVSNKKSVPIITVNGKDDIRIDLVPLKPRRDVIHIRGTMKELLDKADEYGKDNYIYATLTDEDPINDVMSIFQQTYPNMIAIDYDNSHTRAEEQIDISKIAQKKSFEELIGEFYKQIYGCKITPEEMEVMRMVAREAGVIHEAD